MKLEFSPEAVAKIKPLIQPGDQLFLDFEDGDGPFAATGLTCRLDLSFRLIITPQNYPQTGLEIYSLTVETALGSVRLKKSSLMYLDEVTRVVVNPTYPQLELRSDSGILAERVPIIRMDQKIAGKSDGWGS